MPSKVLVADDSPTIRRRATSTLSEAGYEVTCVEDGQAAWAALEAGGPFGVLLCDILMPGLDGYDLCRKVKGDSRFAGLPVLLLRGTFEPWDQNKAVDVGADGYVTKPFDAEALLSTLAEVLADGAGAAPAVAAATAAPLPAPAPMPVEPPAPLGSPLALEEPSPEPIAEPLAEPGPLGEPEPLAEPEPIAVVPEPLAVLGASTTNPPAEPELLAMAPLAAAEPAPLDDSPFGQPDATTADDGDVFGGAADEPLGAVDAAEPLALPADPLGSLTPAPPEQLPPPAPAPVAAASVRPVPAAAPAATVMAGSLEIDDALIERIAARVAARLTAGELERVAWDVVPDVAEALIRKRLGEIEAQLGEG